MPKKDVEKQIVAMRKIGMSEDEIKELIDYDKRVDRGEDDYKLTTEQEKVVKMARNCGTRKAPTVYKLDNTDGNRSRKKNATKAEIIEKLFNFLAESSDFQDLEVINPERMIGFSVGEVNFEITLVQKRVKK